MAKRKFPTTQDELLVLEAKAQEFYASIAPLFEALKSHPAFDKEFCGLVGSLFDHTSRLSPVLKQIELVKKFYEAEKQGLV